MTTVAKPDSSEGTPTTRRAAAWLAVRAFFGEYRAVRDRLRLRWWKELVIVGTFYVVYSVSYTHLTLPTKRIV